MILASKDPGDFQTYGIELTPYAGGINITSVGNPIDFETMQRRRKSCSASIPGQFANLGISAQIHLRIDTQEYLLLVRQEHKDHSVLKLPSGYIPQQQFSNPYLTLAQELAEECLLLDGKLFCLSLLNGCQLEKPYSKLDYNDELSMEFMSEDYNPLQLPQTKVFINQQPLKGQPLLYIHKQTCSVQLVYPLRLELPDSETLSLLHAEEKLNPANQLLEVELSADLWLARLNQGKITQLGKLIRGNVVPMRAPTGTRLSEVLAPRQPLPID
ncbi:hypothetical protein [Amphritea sp. HPY]|uniref:hypothetical protein n=1 Tax=Amphritea sp. HPY TaxID=3421652 RepID=UPI003D7F149C